MGLRKKSDIPFALVLNVVLFLIGYSANGQVPQIAPEWKAHFKTTPVIENCVFEREITASNKFPKGETNLYQFRYQENAFLFRQIRSLNDVSSNNIPTMMGYTGRFESNCWAIDWTADTFGRLKLFPNADKIWRKPPDSGDAMLVFTGERQVFTALYYGIGMGDLVPATVEWPEESKFIALSVFGQKILGEITETSQGRPATVEWHYDDAPDKEFRFILKYKYNTNDANLDLSYYPSEIQISSNRNEQKKMTYKILMMKTSAIPLEEVFFDPKRYFVQPSSLHPRVSILLYSNNVTYNVSDGHLQKVLPPSMIVSIESGGGAKHIILIRVILLGFFAISMIGLLFLWKQKNKRNDQ